MANLGKNRLKCLLLSCYSASTTKPVLSRRCSGTLVRQPLTNHLVQIDPCVKTALDEEQYKHKKHPGVFTSRTQVPPRLSKAIKILLERYPNKKLLEDAEKLSKYLWSRQLPAEDSSLQRRAVELEQNILQKDDIDLDSVPWEEREKLQDKIQKKVFSQLKRTTYHWQPVNYDAYKAFQYMVGRMVHDYTIAHRVLYEVAMRVPQFKPSSLFDYGCGVGTNIWAANSVWPGSLSEHYCVDVSSDISTLARLLLQDGEEEKDMCFDGVYFRQFMPESYKSQFDIVVSGFSLLELPSQAERLKTLLTLWRKTRHFMVLIENGTNAGFRTLIEARDFILQLSESEDFSEKEQEVLHGHVFAPCPHNLMCPQVAKQSKTPCSFDINVFDYTSNTSKTASSRFSYLVLRKGKQDVHEVSWPRVLRPPSTPSRRVHLHTCSPQGQLEYSCITAKRHGKHLFRCARNCCSGDLLPATHQTLDTNRSHILASDENGQDEFHIEYESGSTNDGDLDSKNLWSVK